MIRPLLWAIWPGLPALAAAAWITVLGGSAWLVGACLFAAACPATVALWRWRRRGLPLLLRARWQAGRARWQADGWDETFRVVRRELVPVAWAMAALVAVCAALGLGMLAGHGGKAGCPLHIIAGHGVKPHYTRTCHWSQP